MSGRIIGSVVLGVFAAFAVGCVPAGGEEEITDIGIRDIGPAVVLDMFVPREMGNDDPIDVGTDDDPDGSIADDAAPVVDMAPPVERGDADCRALDACLRACGDADCSRRCREMAPPEGAALYDAIFICARESGCTEPGGALNEVCMETNCSDERLACFGPPAPLDCQGLNACLGQCAEGDQECIDSCNGAASEEGRRTFEGLVQCIDEAACAPEDAACRQGACADFLEACFGVAVVPVGDSDCETLAACINACEPGDADCTNGCFGDSAPEAFNTYQAAIDCLRAAEAQCPEGDQACTQEICEAEIRACIPNDGPTPGGPGTCEQFDDCLRECPDNDQPCIDACIEATSQEGFDQYLAFVDCLNMQCPEGSAPSCGLISCEGPIEACLGEVAVPRGALGCSAFNDCLGTCAEGDQACTDRCINSASARGYDLLLGAINCVNDSGCAPGDADCQQLNCGAEINACFNDF